MENKWCEHMFPSDDGRKYAYAKTQCPSGEKSIWPLIEGNWHILEAGEDWICCPICGTKRPPDIYN